MNKIKNLVAFQFETYIKGSHLVMPIIAIITYLYITYSLKPIKVVDSFLMTEVFSFILMVWIGLSIIKNENVVTEQIMILRVKKSYYYLSKILFIFFLALIVASVCTLFPVVQNFINGNELFERKLGLSDIFNGWLLQISFSFLGGVTGSFFHPLVLKDRKMAMVLTSFVVILSIGSYVIVGQISSSKYFLWVLPPVMITSHFYNNAEYFNIIKTMYIIVIQMIYSLCIFGIRTAICNRRKY